MYQTIKRALDVFIAGVAVIILFPVFLVLALILKFTGEGEVLFIQRRVGHCNAFFPIFKFATMVKRSEKMGLGSITVKNDPRVTKLGKFLRKTKINELPQLFNVLKGDMSFVGPRPLDKHGFEAYPESVRYDVYNLKPGITGLGSLMFRDEEFYLSQADDPHRFYREVIAPYKAELEFYYQKNQSFNTDLKIFFLTFNAVFFPTSIQLSNWFSGLPEAPEMLSRTTPERSYFYEKVEA